MSETHEEIRKLGHDVDLCVVGGGMAGLCAALAAARRGARVMLMHDRPVMGGNASSECRVPICGADVAGQKPYLRETGILEELRLENCRRNPHREYSIWDLILYEKAQYQPNLELLLNCSCLDAEMRGGAIASVTGWQLTTETYHTVKARVFADCSGDGILAPLTGHPFRFGREARGEFGESIQPEDADDRTMGMTCFVQAREYDTPQPFKPPAWAHCYDSITDLPQDNGHRWELENRQFRLGYWWVELGGEDDSIHDTERLREELLRIALGVWDHIKNRGDYGAENWALEWVQFLPGKRESRRYVGAHVLTQNDILAEGRFEDVVAYGGWSMDDHHPAGFRAAKLGASATINHPAPSPYGIPYRSLYSQTVPNLMFAGRCFSATHAALSSARVMGTCCSMGQAVGTAAAMAIERSLSPGGMMDHIEDLQQALLGDDCYLPWVRQKLPELTETAELRSSQGDPSPIRDGFGRQIGDDPHAWEYRAADWVAYELPKPRLVTEIILVLDSGLEFDIALGLYGGHRSHVCDRVPGAMPKRFLLEALTEGRWETLATVEGNYQRFLRRPIGKGLEGLRFSVQEFWDAQSSRLYAFHLT